MEEAAEAADEAAPGPTSEVSEWARRYLDKAAPQRRANDDDEDEGSTSSDEGGEPLAGLQEAVLAKCFAELSEAERLARLEGDEVVLQFKVYLRGCEAAEQKSGDRLDVGRAGGVGAEVDRWLNTHFQHKTKSYKLLLVGEDAAGQLLREWCRRMQFFWNLWAEHGSWAASGGAAALDSYRETADYEAWLDALPPASPARARGLELRKLRPRMV